MILNSNPTLPTQTPDGNKLILTSMWQVLQHVTRPNNTTQHNATQHNTTYCMCWMFALDGVLCHMWFVKTGSNIDFAGWKNQSSLNFTHVLLLVSKCQRTNRRDTETGSDSSVPSCCRWLKSVWRVNEQNQTAVIKRLVWSCNLFCWTHCAPGSGRGRAGRRGHWSSRRWCTEPLPPANTQTHKHINTHFKTSED